MHDVYTRITRIQNEKRKKKKTLIEYIFKKMHSEAQNVCKPFDFIHGRVQIAFITNSIELLMKTK